VNLTPIDYTCDTHKQPLTELVHEQLEPVIVASFARSTPRPFRVIVTCPGDGAQGSSHQIACSGTMGA
jgi:hypothetical protein